MTETMQDNLQIQAFADKLNALSPEMKETVVKIAWIK